MSLQNLKFFLMVLECGGVTKAAARLRLSQPAVSAGLKALEAEIGCPLFDRRDGRRIVPTAAGLKFAGRARKILADYESARAEAAGHSASPLVRIGILQTVGRQDVVAGLSALRTALPSWRFEFWEGLEPQLDRRLAQQRLDLAWTILTGPDAGEVPLSEERLVAAVPPGHPFVLSGQDVGLEDLGREPFIFRASCELSELGERRLVDVGIRLNIVGRVVDDALGFGLVGAGMGITLAPESLVPDGLLAVGVRGLNVGRRLGLKFRAGLSPELAGRIGAVLGNCL
jgi:DNA-binding transcriptional LysR family regulator